MGGARGDPLLFGGTDDPEPPPGVAVMRGRVPWDACRDAVSAVIVASPPYPPRMKAGTPFKVAIASAGRVGWTSDEFGYRYADRHPVTGEPWPPIPEELLGAARGVAAEAGWPGFDPDTLLLNLYSAGSSLGLHQDDTERDLSSPIVSLSFGDDCTFRMGGQDRGAPKSDWRLRHGDAVVFGGPARLAWHGVPRTFPGTGPALPWCSRLNLTFRRS